MMTVKLDIDNKQALKMKITAPIKGVTFVPLRDGAETTLSERICGLLKHLDKACSNGSMSPELKDTLKGWSIGMLYAMDLFFEDLRNVAGISTENVKKSPEHVSKKLFRTIALHTALQTYLISCAKTSKQEESK